MRARVVAVFLVCCWVFLVDPICAKPNPYGWSHIHLVDHFSDKDGFTNLLFRTGIPDNATNQFAYDDLAREFRKHADDAHVPFPDDYDLVDLCLLTSEIDDIKLEHDWYVAHPDLGTFQWWPLEGVSRETVEEGCRTVGIPPDRCPSEQPKDFTDADKKLLSLKFNTWTPDRLEEKLDRTHTMIHTRGKKPVIVFGHCECGCDRTGDFFGAYMIRYLGLSYVEAMKINESIPQRHIGYTHQVSIQWYCNKLRYQGDYRGNDCDDCEDFRCSDSVEGPRVTSW